MHSLSRLIHKSRCVAGVSVRVAVVFCSLDALLGDEGGELFHSSFLGQPVEQIQEEGLLLGG
jgi:hypothetical protein